MAGPESDPPGGETTIVPAQGSTERSGPGEVPRRWALATIWCEVEPERVGQILLLPARPGVVELGRGAGDATAAPRLEPVQQRPGINEPTAPLGLRGVSRTQLRLRTRRSGGVAVDNVGRCPMLVNGVECSDAMLDEGDVVELRQQIAFVCIRRPELVPPSRDFPPSEHPAFGEADAFGLVGESPAAWALRCRLAFVGARQDHVLVLGDSGTGKELAARAIHGLSSRAAHPLVARSAATLPEGLIDAELFGNAANYPNPGMKDRPGLIGQADQSTLFLDEIGELPPALQTHLLRVLDQGGEYHRLGEATPRRSSLRLVAATNRDLSELKHDFGARFKLRLRVPGLDTRREDVALLVQHLLRRIAADDAALEARFFTPSEDGPPRPRIDPALVGALVRHEYHLAVRELEALLWSALSSSPGDRIALTDEVEVSPPAPTTAEPTHVHPEALDPARVQAALDEHDGVQEKVWRALGLKNRFVLLRFIRKHGLVVKR